MLNNISRLALSIGSSLIILALLLMMINSGLSDGERPSVFAALSNTAFTYVFLYLVLYLITLMVRAYRYQLLIRLSGEPNTPNLKQMALVTGIRNMVVDMLPARLGELGYIGLLNRGYGVRLEHCISSLGASVAFDFVALLVVVLMIAAIQITGGEIQSWTYGVLLSAVALASIAFLGLFRLLPWASGKLTKRFEPTQAEGSWASKGLDLLNRFSNSIVEVRDSGRLVVITGLSVTIRVLKYFGMYLLFVGVAIPSFDALAALPFEKIVSALIGGELGASLPVPTFMSFGAYEAGGALIFYLLDVADKAAAVVTLLCTHIWSQLIEYLIGGSLLAFYFWRIRPKTKPSGDQEMNNQMVSESSDASKSNTFKTWLKHITAVIVLMTGSVLFAWQLWAATKLGSFTAPDAGAVSENVEEWRELSKQHVSSIDGFAVFSSNRGGNHDIYKLNFSDFSLTAITDHPHTETYPRISPNGNQLVFSRSHTPWVSQRNVVAWDVYLLDLDSGEEKKVGTNGTSAHWLDDDTITYLKDATTVVSVNIKTGEEKLIYQTGLDNPMPKGAHIQNPKYNPKTKQVVFTGRQNQIRMNSGHWGTAITIGNKHKGLYDGCELNWNSQNDGLFQVAKGGRDNGGPNNGLRIVSVDPETYEMETLIDLDGEFSHEYWPKDSWNGEYMVFGASRGAKDHEHDTKDYEIFLWKVGSDYKQATRLTFHSGNDNWPDVYVRR